METKYTSDFVRHRISQLRLERNLSERELSCLINKSHSYIKDINRRRALPTFESFLLICECLEVTPAEFFDARVIHPSVAKSISIELDRLLGDEELLQLLSVLKNLRGEHVKLIKRLFHIISESVRM